jgi:hypothetical protein
MNNHIHSRRDLSWQALQAAFHQLDTGHLWSTCHISHQGENTIRGELLRDLESDISSEASQQNVHGFSS